MDVVSLIGMISRRYIFAALMSGLILYIYFTQPNKAKKRIIISDIYVYPIKSCGGIRLDIAQISKRGLLHDRVFALINRKSVNITIRCHPKMAVIETAFSKDEQFIIVSAPGMSRTISIPLYSQTNSTQCERITIWNDSVDAYEVSEDFSAWFSEYLGEKDIRLMRMSDQFKRVTDPNFSADGQISLADEFPFMMVSNQAVQLVNEHLETPVTIRNFRPNFVISGCEPFEEDTWKSVRLRELVLSVAKPCSRCSLPNVNPFTGVRDNRLSVTKALREFRTGKHLGVRKEWERDVFFGVHLNHHSAAWPAEMRIQVQVGDPLEIQR